MVKIVVDSTADMQQEVAQRVSIVRLTVRFGEKEYISGVDIDGKKFYEMLIESDVLPTTSQAAPYAFAEKFEQALADGSEVVCLTCASKLSGTHQSALIAAQEYPGKVHVVDSGTIAIGLGILTEYALKLVDSGMDAREIVRKLERKRDDIRLLAMVDTLEYLKKGGRISAATAMAGSLLNIKPVLTIDAGEIRVLGKARGSRQANNLLVQEIEKAGGVDFTKPLMLGYTGLSDAVLEKYIADSAALWQNHTQSLPCAIVGSVVGTHVGPGAVAVAFFAAEQEK
ncbi:MAG: DegV family protein [Oscillospiraceae bacterium]|nr:DegV family protein [Oscillospiraceae bacterium]